VLAIIAGLAGAAVCAAAVDVARAGGGIKGDEATYVGLAASVGFDGDLVYSARDYGRFREWYGSGPEGIFLKRGADDRLYFGKAYLYGVLAGPFIRIGGLSGLFFFNLACLVLVGLAGYLWLRPGSRPLPALAWACVFVFASVAPLYAFWLTSETLNFALVFLAFALAVSPAGAAPRKPGWQVAGALCLAAAIFSKPLNLPLTLSLALAAGGTRRRATTALAVVGVAVAALFAINALVTGELNYQGGERKTFYGQFPFDETGQSFDTVGISMTTNTVQTPVGREGRLAPVAQNAWYFIAGRHFGLIPFGWPWLVACGLWLVTERAKTASQWALVGSLTLAAIGTIVWMPYTWSGGGGPVGNRYFLSLGGASFFLMPRVQSWLPAAVAALGLVFMGPTLSAPFTVTKQPWLAARAGAFRLLPLELTGASDFPEILDQRRGRIPQGRHPTVFVALLDEAGGIGRSGWMSVSARAGTELLVRSPERLEQVTIGIKSPGPCQVALSSGQTRDTVTLGADDRKDTQLTPRQTFSRDSFVFVLSVDASACEAPIEVALQGQV